jgi:hypothetical protein
MEASVYGFAATFNHFHTRVLQFLLQSERLRISFTAFMLSFMRPSISELLGRIYLSTPLRLYFQLV